MIAEAIQIRHFIKIHSLYSSATTNSLFSEHNSEYAQSNDETTEGSVDERDPDVLSQQLECLRTTVHDLLDEWEHSNNRMRDILDVNKDVIAMANEILKKACEIRAAALSLQGEPTVPTTCTPRFKQIAKEIIRRSKVNNGTEESQYLNSKYVEISNVLGVVGTFDMCADGCFGSFNFAESTADYDVVLIWSSK